MNRASSMLPIMFTPVEPSDAPMASPRALPGARTLVPASQGCSSALASDAAAEARCRLGGRRLVVLRFALVHLDADAGDVIVLLPAVGARAEDSGQGDCQDQDHRDENRAGHLLLHTVLIPSNRRTLMGAPSGRERVALPYRLGYRAPWPISRPLYSPKG